MLITRIAEMVHAVRRTVTMTVAFMLALLMSVSGSYAYSAGVEKLDVVFIYSGPARDGGWTQTFDDARQQLEKRFGEKIATSVKEKVIEGPQSERVIQSAIQNGANVIVSTSFGFGEAMLKMASKNPNVFFITSQWDNPGNLDNFAGFVNAPEDGAYVAGVAAGHIMDQGGTVGWVDAFPIPYDLRTINGFARGLAHSNPDASLRVVFTNSWIDTSLMGKAARSLINSGADFISTSLVAPAVGEAAEAAGIPFIAAATDGRQYAPKMTVTTFKYYWEPVLGQMLKSILDGNFDTSFRYAGMNIGAVDMSEWGGAYEALSDEAKADINTEYERIRSGQGSVFTGPLVDIHGKTILADGEVLSVEGLRGMDFVLPNVKGVNF